MARLRCVLAVVHDLSAIKSVPERKGENKRWVKYSPLLSGMAKSVWAGWLCAGCLQLFTIFLQ